MSVNFNPSNTSTPSASVCRTGKTPFELNSDAYGPVAASVIGAAEAAVNLAGSTVTFSDKALQQLTTSAHEAASTVEEAAHGVGQWLSDGVHEVESGVQQLGTLASDGYHSVESAIGSVVDGVTDAADTAASRVGHAVSSVYGAVGDAAGQAASYAALGVQALRAMV